MTPSEKLIAYREKHGLSYRELGKRFHCAPSNVLRFEEGTRRPSLDVAFNMEEAGVCPAKWWRRKRVKSLGAGSAVA